MKIMMASKILKKIPDSDLDDMVYKIAKALR